MAEEVRVAVALDDYTKEVAKLLVLQWAVLGQSGAFASLWEVLETQVVFETREVFDTRAACNLQGALEIRAACKLKAALWIRQVGLVLACFQTSYQ